VAYLTQLKKEFEIEQIERLTQLHLMNEKASEAAASEMKQSNIFIPFQQAGANQSQKKIDQAPTPLK
jgi:hypothetical protein